MEKRERERSNSFIRRMMKKKIKKCSWNFAFKLVFRDKEYELYAPNRNDRTQWVKILSAIAEINKQKDESFGVQEINICNNPIEYLRQKG